MKIKRSELKNTQITQSGWFLSYFTVKMSTRKTLYKCLNILYGVAILFKWKISFKS